MSNTSQNLALTPCDSEPWNLHFIVRHQTVFKAKTMGIKAVHVLYETRAANYSKYNYRQFQTLQSIHSFVCLFPHMFVCRASVRTCHLMVRTS